MAKVYDLPAAEPSLEKLDDGIPNLIINGNDLNNLILAANQPETINGGPGNDTIEGRGGSDTLRGRPGSDIVSGGKGDDMIVANHADGNDHYHGGAGLDTLDPSAVGGVVQVNQIAGTVTGSAGSDTLADVFERVIGTSFNDVLSGSHGNEALDGGGGNDQIFANNGNDWVTGGTGTDTITLGVGDDVFQFFDGDGSDTITDFIAGASTQDRINLKVESSATSLAQMQADNLISQDGADTVIDFGGGDVITLLGVNMADLHADDFIF